MRTAILTAPLICCALFAAIPIEPAATLFDNDQVRVVRGLEKAHVKASFHEHKPNRVMIYLQPGRQAFEYKDSRKPETFDWKEGEVKWSPADGMHSPEVTGDNPFNIIEIELKHAGGGTLPASAKDPVKIAPKQFKVEFENDQVRVVRAKLAPHAKVPMHEHTSNRVSVYLTDEDVRVTGADGKATDVHRKAGEAVWSTPGSHGEQNLSDKPVEVILVDIKA